MIPAHSDDQFVLHDHAQRIRALAKQTAAGIVEIGRLLIEVKEHEGHGKFLKWIKDEFKWSEPTAQRFMRVNREFKSVNLTDMQIDVSALYLIASSKTPEPVRLEVIRRAEAGEPITHEAVKVLRKRYEETGELPDEPEKLIAMVADAKRDMADLPSPAEARKMAIASGAHTLARNGTYIPPVTKEVQEQTEQDLYKTIPLRQFIDRPAISPVEFAQMLRRRKWATTFPKEKLTDAIHWLRQVRSEQGGA